MKLSAEEREAALGALPDWSFAPGESEGGGAIARSFRFSDFSQAFAFMTRVAIAAEKADHHPDWSNSWNRVEISLSTTSRTCLPNGSGSRASAARAIASNSAGEGGGPKVRRMDCS